MQSHHHASEAPGAVIHRGRSDRPPLRLRWVRWRTSRRRDAIHSHSIDFEDTAALADLREAGRQASVVAGLPEERGHDVQLAISELATNSLEHGGGRGQLDIWADRGAVVCVVTDAGQIDPHEGLRPPDPLATRGRGLWIVNQVCDEVQRETSPEGTTTRIVIRS